MTMEKLTGVVNMNEQTVRLSTAINQIQATLGELETRFANLENSHHLNNYQVEGPNTRNQLMQRVMNLERDEIWDQTW